MNPNRTGGGASIAYAMHMGLPILMNNYPSDALPYVGIENTTENYSGMAEKLEKFVNDNSYYQQWKEKTLQRANAYSTAHAISQYIDGIEVDDPPKIAGRYTITLVPVLPAIRQ